MADASPQPDPTHPTARRLKLVLKTSDDSSDPLTPNLTGNGTRKDESSSPPRPSFSPVTPTLPHESGPRPESTGSRWMEQPPSMPVSLDDNADAIALRATISLLQMQRQQSLKGLKQLESMKREALEDPETFVEELRNGSLNVARTENSTHANADSDTDDEAKADVENASRFGKIPNAQNVARCPPIEWSKYHILGQPLDAMHEIQQRYPGVSDDHLAQGLPLREHEISAPYRPFVDDIKTRKGHDGYNT